MRDRFLRLLTLTLHALRSSVFCVQGTAGQRCTTFYVSDSHEKCVGWLVASLAKSYGSLRVGNPLVDGNPVGPLIDERSLTLCTAAIERNRSAARVAKINFVVASRVQKGGSEAGVFYVKPAIFVLSMMHRLFNEETFARDYYVLTYSHLRKEALKFRTIVPQGICPSAVFTESMP